MIVMLADMLIRIWYIFTFFKHYFIRKEKNGQGDCDYRFFFTNHKYFLGTKLCKF